MKLSKILKIETISELNNFLKENFAYNLEERNLTQSKIKKHWSLIGDNPSNASNIDVLSHGEKGIIERITNGIDAIMENCFQKNPKNDTIEKILQSHFPRYNAIREDAIKNNNTKKMYSKDAENQVVIAVNDGEIPSRPTIDIYDLGIGLEGSKFNKTILSLQGGNKISSDKKYLIGTFGQGGSTSLSFTDATIIISKINNEYFYSVVKSVDLSENKNHAYVYLTNSDKKIIALENDISDWKGYKHIENYLSSENGTFIRMLGADISSELRNGEVTKPKMLLDYINTELYDTKIPVKLIENRERYLKNKHVQSRNIYGTKLKLKTSKNNHKDFNGKFKFEHNNYSYEVEYFTILPIDEDEWGLDNKCKEKYKEFNYHEKPIFYTVSGQYISGEAFIKLKNNGLNFLQYRLLVNVNLDSLGQQKYKFFTTDRNKIKHSEFTSGFREALYKKIASEPTLINLNNIIAEKSINSSIDKDILDNISREVKDKYLKFLKNKGGHINPPGSGGKKNNILYKNRIETIEIFNKKKIFYSNENIDINVSTGATKPTNIAHKFDIFVNDRAVYPDITYLNGKITFSLNTLNVGNHVVEVMISNLDISSNKYEFLKISDKKPENGKLKGDLNFEIKTVNGAELICDVVESKSEKKLIVYICTSHDIFKSLFGNLTESQLNEKRKKLISPIALFTLYLSKDYTQMENVEKKNNLVSSLIKSFSSSM